ncbi:MAG: hypothetical protein AB1489_36040 [Acidobacteriota bacterium]
MRKLSALALIIALALLCGAAIAQLDPKQPAAVSISFDGMEALFFGNPDLCSLTFLNVTHHTPKMTITKIANGRRTTVAMLKGEQLRGSLMVEVEGRRATGVSRYQAASMDEDVHDARWLIDMNELHPGTLTIKEEKLFGKIHFSAGLFYADKLSETPARFFATDRSNKTLSFNRRIGEPAAKIDLVNGDALVIHGSDTNIRLVAMPGVRYEIAITNLPSKNMMSMDHFIGYYSIIKEPLQRYVPIHAFKSAVVEPFPTVCPSVVFTGTKVDVP